MKLHKATLAVATCLALIVQQSNGQDSTDQDSKVYELQEFVVSGQRATNRNSIIDKKTNDALVDSLGADELGGLPDRNLGEALGRIVGVTTIEDEGVGRYASVRGLKSEYVNVTLDGGGISSAVRPWDADAGRATNLQAINPDVISKVQVFKSITPDLDGSSIAGTINLVTRSAYDTGDRYIGIKASIGEISGGSIATIDPDLPIKLNGTASFLMGKEGQFGLVVNGSYSKIERLVLKEDILYSWGDPAIPAYPGGNWDAFTDESAIKKGGFAKFEFRPSHSFYIYASINYFEEAEDWKKNEHILWDSGSYDQPTKTFNGFAALLQPRHTEFGTDDAFTYSSGFSWESQGGGMLSGNANLSSSEFYLKDVRGQWIAAWGGLDGTYNANGRDWDLVMDEPSAAIFTDIDQYYFNEHRNEHYVLIKDVDTAQLDWGKNIKTGDIGWGYKLGAKLSRNELDFSQRYFRGDKASKTGFDIYKYTDDHTVTDYVGTLGVPLIMGSVAGIEADIEEVGLESYKQNFGRWKSNFSNANDYTADEEIAATYLMGRYGSERTSAVFGVRYEATDWSGQSRLDNAEDGEIVQSGGGYDHFLPSANFTHRLSNAWALRASYHMAVGRPEAKDLVPLETTPDFVADNGKWRIYRSNPDLQAREANNFDLSTEYYFDEGNSIFTIGIFYKQIKNEIYDLTSTETVTFTDPDTGELISAAAEVTQPRNAGDANVGGIETAIIVDSLKFLPEPFNGIGFQANFTYLDGGMDLIDGDGNVFRQLDQLHHQPKSAFNFVVFYEHKKFSLRLAAKHYTEMVYDLADDPLQDLIQDDLTRFDFHAEYRFTENTELFLDVANLTEESTLYYGGPWDETVNYGRTIWIGLKVRL